MPGHYATMGNGGNSFMENSRNQHKVKGLPRLRFRKTAALFIVAGLLTLTYYLSSIPYLRVLPVLREIHIFLSRINLGIADVARAIAARLPQELESVSTITGDLYHYARQNPVIIEFLLRKSAHVALFFIITIALFMLWRHYFKPVHAVLAAFISGALIAILDEVFQYYVAGRTGNIIDVGFNMAGVSLAIALITIAFILIEPVYRNKHLGPCD